MNFSDPTLAETVDARRITDQARPFREGVVVVVRVAGRFLVIRRGEVEIAPGAWCFVGGGIEAGEEQPEAVRREFLEEVGGAATPVRKLWEWWRADRKLLLHWWLADLEHDRLEANPLEVAELRWCDMGELLALPNLLDSNREFLRLLSSGAISIDGR